MYTVVVTGPESTGKTEICKFLADAYGTAFVPEYARGYVASLNRPYVYEDVEKIARVQVEQLAQHREGQFPILFLDTYLIITKVWLREVFGYVPDWIDEAMAAAGINLFLLCYPDIPWVPDPLRENPEPRRSMLYQAYREEIEKLGWPCEVIGGKGTARFSNAEKAVGKHFTGFRDQS
jgi:nicotinamide riboside kinase